MSERQLDAHAILDSSVIRTNELQVWFVAEHVVDMPLVHAEHSEQVGR